MINHLHIRQLIEKNEESLSPFAVKSRSSHGRLKPEDPCPVRTAFQRDRDRIIHSKAFRRLKHKTQVFIAPLGDHYVTRLTHTLEVAQIARTIARALNLNEDLTEAIAMGHDLGHTPFGHVGEDVLDELYSKGFKHNEQSLRVVGILEKNGQGLNLTREVRDGIVNHSKMRANIMGKDSTRANTMEGQVCQISDAIAYINHDIGDAIRAGIITEHSLPLGPINALGYSHSHRINTMVCDVIETSLPTNGYNKPDTPIIGMSQPVLGATNQLRDFLFEQVYNLRSTLKESEKAKEVVRLLYQYFKQHEDQMPAEYRFYDSDTERRVVDYIAGMTDRYALRTAEELALTKTETGKSLY